jgi:phosphoribosyl 1,2-cyclic phosphate phosphodiesterase
MKVTFLGTGTSQGIPIIGCECGACTSSDKLDKRLRVSVCVEVHGKNILIDISPDFRFQMLRAGIQRIDAILLTHEHRDHVGGLDDIRPLNFKYSMDMPVYAVYRVQKALRSAFSYIFETNYPGVPQVIFNTIEKNKSFRIGETKITPVEYLHAKLPVLGFRIGNFAYITDIKTIDDDQLELLKGLDLLVLSALHHEPHYSHINLEEALNLSAKIAAKETYLTHFSHYMGKTADVAPTLPKNVFMAYDELVLELTDPLPENMPEIV